MKTKHTLILAGALFCATAFAEYDCQTLVNGIGDWDIVTLGGFTLTKPISVDLSPTNAPDANVRYSVRCRVAYRDNIIPYPMSDDEFDLVRRIGGVLNSWLKDFIVAECAGAEYSSLRKAYISKEFAENLNELFPKYVARQISAMDPQGRPDIDTVTVTVEAEGAFREDLISEIASRKSE